MLEPQLLDVPFELVAVVVPPKVLALVGGSTTIGLVAPKRLQASSIVALARSRGVPLAALHGKRLLKLCAIENARQCRTPCISQARWTLTFCAMSSTSSSISRATQ